MRPLVLASVLLMSGCALLPGQNDDVPKARCDEFASRAIQSDDLEEAKNLAARASECYASLQNQ